MQTDANELFSMTTWKPSVHVWQVFPMIEMAKQWNRLVGETVGYPGYDSLKNSLGAHLSGMPWGIFDAAFDQRAIQNHFPVSYPLLLLCVTVKAKGRSEWRGCRKDLERSASESKDSILIENTNLDKGSMENRKDMFTNISAVTVKCLYLTVRTVNSRCR